MSHVSVPQPPVGAMSNSYAGKCCGCDAWVAARFGATQRKVRRWLAGGGVPHCVNEWLDAVTVGDTLALPQPF